MQMASKNYIRTVIAPHVPALVTRKGCVIHSRDEEARLNDMKGDFVLLLPTWMSHE